MWIQSFFFSQDCHRTKIKETNLPIARRRIVGFIPFPRVFAGHCWRSRDELIRDVLLWTPPHSRAKAGRPARTYIQQLCEDTGCCLEDLPRAMNDREEWRERVRDIRDTSATWWWWWWWFAWNANNLVQELNSCRHVHFQQKQQLHDEYLLSNIRKEYTHTHTHTYTHIYIDKCKQKGAAAVGK